jgi:hypothetical protein
VEYTDLSRSAPYCQCMNPFLGRVKSPAEDPLSKVILLFLYKPSLSIIAHGEQKAFTVIMVFQQARSTCSE